MKQKGFDFIKEDKELRKNGEGYPDPTAYEAIKRLETNGNYSSIHSNQFGNSDCLYVFQ